MKISEDSLEFAKAHISKYYDSDFFVIPFEFQAIWSQWNSVKDHLLSHELKDLEIQPPLSFAAPKHNYGFRIVHQLDPLNALVYTALAKQVATVIEANRIPISEKVACSFRIEVDDSGNFFASGNGYENFQEKSSDLAKSYAFVLLTDISNFYNQINIHRLQNSIASCDSDLNEISIAIEKFIMKLNNGASKGIPVGPAASIVFAEASLLDIDQFISEKEFEYTRYVDDFRIFANSETDLICLLEKLSHYLYANHRMSIGSSKTEVLPSDEFIQKHLKLPEELEKKKIHKTLEELTIQVNQGYSFFEAIELKDLPPEDKIKIQAETLTSLLSEIIKLEKLDLGLARHILRRAGKLRTRAIYGQILGNIDFFAPVVRDVVIYLERVSSSKVIDDFKDAFIDMIENSQTKHLPYVGYWLRSFFAKYPMFYNIKEVKDFMNSSADIRNLALCAKQNKLISWIREYKDRATSLGSWEKRAVMHSSLALSRDERRKWMTNIESSSNNFLDKTLAKYLRSHG